RQFVDREIGRCRFRGSEADVDQKMTDVFTFTGPGRRSGRVPFVFGQQPVVRLEVRTAPRSVSDDRVEALDIEKVQVAPGKRTRRLRLAIVSMERSATELNRRRVHF